MAIDFYTVLKDIINSPFSIWVKVMLFCIICLVILAFLFLRIRKLRRKENEERRKESAHTPRGFFDGIKSEEVRNAILLTSRSQSRLIQLSCSTKTDSWYYIAGLKKHGGNERCKISSDGGRKLRDVLRIMEKQGYSKYEAGTGVNLVDSETHVFSIAPEFALSLEDVPK